AQYRPLFLGVTFAFLAAAFYFAYRPRRHVADAPASEAGKDACSAVPAESATCCPPAGSAGWTLQKFNRGMLWAVTAVVLAFAFFPNYVGALIGNPSLTSAEAAQGSVVLPIDGMTCEACAVHIQANLAKVPGVTRAVVSYKDKNAVVMAGPGVRREALVEAVEAAGYRVSAPAKN
ncbi:MAG: cation transporter, partial [Verrucomicrobiota bacterium]|nr:cation transporter [Verrucomicrobiota bacterium]